MKSLFKEYHKNKIYLVEFCRTELIQIRNSRQRIDYSDYYIQIKTRKFYTGNTYPYNTGKRIQ